VTSSLRLPALALAAALAACGEDPAVEASLLLAEPSAVAVYRGLTPKHAEVHPYLAVANAATNDLTLLDAVNDSQVLAPVPLRPMVIPVPGRPALLVSADLGDSTPGDERPDLLAAVSAGSSVLQVIATWIPGGGVACGGEGEPACIDLGADVLALVALPPEGGEARVAAALAGGTVAVARFGRAGTPDDAIDVANVGVSATALSFQPVALAITPGDGTRLWAATPDLPGVARIDVSGAGVPTEPGVLLDARAPTRLVAAARLAERAPGSAVVYQQAGVDPSALVSAFEGQPVVDRVYAVLDESFCGLEAEIACGLVALDPDTGALVPDPAPAGTMQAPFRAPIPIPGRPLALGATPPPAVPPSAADPIFAGTYLRIGTNLGARASTGAAAVASSDGSLYHVDLGRWEIPSDRLVHENVGATVTAAAELALDPASAVTVTPGFTPTARWTVTFEGVLPGLRSRRAQVRNEGGPALALQVGEGGSATEVVRLYDPTLGVRPGDTVVIEVIDPSALGTCTGQFEVAVADLLEPASSTIPGGAVLLAEKDPTNPAWHSCFTTLQAIGTEAIGGLRATFRAGGANPYVLSRGTATAAIHVGRPAIGEPFGLGWTDETAFGACALPPAVPWPGNPDDVPLCTDACRTACQDLLRARLARRIGYVPERGSVDPAGPALAFTLALGAGAEPARDLALVIDTVEGRTPFRHGDPAGPAVNPRAVVPFDRSPYAAAGGVRFLVPYASGVVLDATPTARGGVTALR
jgi:hypothetical protein